MQWERCRRTAVWYCGVRVATSARVLYGLHGQDHRLIYYNQIKQAARQRVSKQVTVVWRVCSGEVLRNASSRLLSPDRPRCIQPAFKASINYVHYHDSNRNASKCIHSELSSMSVWRAHRWQCWPAPFLLREPLQHESIKFMPEKLIGLRRGNACRLYGMQVRLDSNCNTDQLLRASDVRSYAQSLRYSGTNLHKNGVTACGRRLLQGRATTKLYLGRTIANLDEGGTFRLQKTQTSPCHITSCFE